MHSDVLGELGALAFGTRLKRLSDRVMHDGAKMYRATGIAFEPKWFPVYYYLSEMGPRSIMDIANKTAQKCTGRQESLSSQNGSLFTTI